EEPDDRRVLHVQGRAHRRTPLERQHASGRVQRLHASGAPGLMYVKRSKKIHDVIVIGSGASGGMAAWNLTRQGVKVLMLDAGAKFDRSRFWTHVKPWEWNQRIDRGDHPQQFYVDPDEQPYETPKDHPFELRRVWGRGGKTNVWGRVSLRYSDLDF